MATLKIDKEEVHVSDAVVTRIVERMWRLGNDQRRAAYVARARKRIDAGKRGRNDLAVIVVADHPATG